MPLAEEHLAEEIARRRRDAKRAGIEAARRAAVIDLCAGERRAAFADGERRAAFADGGGLRGGSSNSRSGYIRGACTSFRGAGN